MNTVEITINPNTKIFIIEGIAGAGKNTLHQQLKEQLSDKLIYDYSEEELMFSWKHGWIKNIDVMRLAFFENLLNYCESILSQKSNAIFILNRFHVSYRIFTLLTDSRSESRLNDIIKKLKQLSSFVYIPVIDDNIIEMRSAHKERTDPVWQIHLQKRLEQRGFATLKDMYGAEQKKIISTVKAQGLLYEIVNLKIALP